MIQVHFLQPKWFNTRVCVCLTVELLRLLCPHSGQLALMTRLVSRDLRRGEKIIEFLDFDDLICSKTTSIFHTQYSLTVSLQGTCDQPLLWSYAVNLPLNISVIYCMSLCWAAGCIPLSLAPIFDIYQN